jgi:hypothetical protein
MIRYAFPLAVLLALAAPASGAQPPPKTPAVNILIFGADAVVRVNGFAIDRASHGGPKVSKHGNMTTTDSSPTTLVPGDYATYCSNGDDTISVDATITHPGGYVEMVVSNDIFSGPKLFDKTLKQNGSASYTLHLKGLPAWSWTKADTGVDDKDGLLKAVTALQTAATQRDAATIVDLLSPTFADIKAMGMDALMGGDPAKQLSEMVNKDKLKPEPAIGDLIVEGSPDGRLFSVGDKQHNPPVKFTSPDGSESATLGTVWARFGGKWQVVH